jgi:sporulation protein YabP
MEENKLRPIYKQILNVVNFKELTLNGVLNICGFEDGLIALDTESGRLFIEGENLKIESLEKEGGSVLVTGEVRGIFREEQGKLKKGIFSRLFG